MAKTKKTVSKTSTKASGLTISRSYGKFTCSWKPSYSNTVQWIYQACTKVVKNKKGKWIWSWASKPKWVALPKKTTSKAITYTVSNYCPKTTTKIYAVRFAVRGKFDNVKATKKKKGIKYKISPSSGYKTFGIKAPLTPTISVERQTATKSTFTANVTKHYNNNAYWATYIQFRTVLRLNNNDSGVPSDATWAYRWATNSNPGGWQPIYDGITHSDTTTWTYVIDESRLSEIENARDAVRWVGFRVAGPAGYSPWAYAKVAYGAPYPAEIQKATVKKNAQRGLDCTVEWIYKHSLSFPVNEMTVQYSLASPGGIYTEYVHTDDLEVDSSKTYYTLTATYVVNPTPDDVGEYYNKVEAEYYLTLDDEPEEGKTYYTVSAVVSPVVENIRTYYVDVDGVYVKTTDIAIDTEKTYYTISTVVSPSAASMDTYYEKTDEYYVKTTDTTIDKFEKYYTVVASKVTTPVDANIYLYYELEKTNYMGPVSPNWEDAVIGGDNKITTTGVSNAKLVSTTAKASFKIDAEKPVDQILYVRVNTVHDGKTTNSAYYMCTDDEKGTVADKDVLLTEPSFSEPVTPGSNNYISFSVTDNSSASGVRIAVVFLPPEGEDNDNTKVIAVLEPDQTREAAATIEIPPEYTTSDYGIGIYSFIGQYGLTSRIEGDNNIGYDLYLVTPIIRSKLVTYGGEIPLPATNVQANHLSNGNVLVTWDWNWKDADTAEVAWSDYPDALDSTEEPSTHQVPNSKSNKLIVRNLEQGKTWYFWVRLYKGENTSVWSSVAFESLSSSPTIPTLSLSKRYINSDEKFIASWVYVSTDGSSQQSADICLCTIDENNAVTHGEIVAQIPNDEVTDAEIQYVTINPEKLGWTEGQTYYLAVQVTSSTGMVSEKWSEPAPVSIIEPIDSTLVSTSLYPSVVEYDKTATYAVDDYILHRNGNEAQLYKCIVAIDTPEEWNDEHWAMDDDLPCQELTTLSPELTITATPSTDEADITVIIERAEDYFVDRPDEGTYGGHTGDVVAQMNEAEDNVFSITQEDLTGYLDDGAYYYYVIRTTDDYGQVNEVRYKFVVHWSHQALMPSASIAVDAEHEVPKITINTPENIPAGDSIVGDVCDIYRKSADGYTMLYSGAEFDHTYVDPYPTIGEHGGYRVVYRTRNGDYITSDNNFAWVDFDEDDFLIQSASHIIDFGANSVELMFNVNIDNNWAKDFHETKYLGGSIQGDWNSGVSKTSTISVNVPTVNWETVDGLRRLAMYTGICHVRTRDGSNFLANVEVSEKYPYETYFTPDRDLTHLCEYSLAITRLDPIEEDGMTLDEWMSTLPEAEGATGATGETGE